MTLVSEYREECIVKYTAAGYTLFPCKIEQQKNGKIVKKPAERNWQQTKFDPMLEPESLPKSYGVLLKEADLVLDVDPRRFTSNHSELLQLIELVGELRDTFIVRSGSGDGGVHLYFKKPPDFKVRSVVPGFPAIECKTAGKFVIAAGSRHPNGFYKIEKGTPMIVQPAPEALLRKIADITEYCADDIEVDDEGTRTRFIQFLMRFPPAVEGEAGDNQTYRAACEGREYGLSENVCFQLLWEYYNPRCIPEWKPAELRAKVEHAYKYARNAQGAAHPSRDFADIETNAVDAEETVRHAHVIGWDEAFGNGGQRYYLPTLNNAVNFFYVDHGPKFGVKNPLKDILRFNSFTSRIEFIKLPPWQQPGELRPPYWTDTDTIQFKYYLSSKHGFTRITKELCREAPLIVASQHSYHPVVTWLESLSWDGVRRLDNFLVRYAGCGDNAYVREAGKNTILGAVARIYEPGCQQDYMLVLDGAQGMEKSKFVRVLGGQWYADVPIDTRNKDTLVNMRGKWIIEASEMAFVRKIDIESLKGFLTRVSDTVRLPYGHDSVDLPRQCIFIGTVNPGADGTYLTDTTGNRRFWPVSVTKIDLKGLERDRDQLFAEAVVRYKAGEPWYIVDRSVEAMAKAEQDRRVTVDLWEEVVGDWLNRNHDNLLDITLSDIAYQALSILPAKITKPEKTKLTHVMQKLGYVMANRWSKKDKCQKWVWLKEESDV